MADEFITAKLVGHLDVLAAFQQLREDLPKNWIRKSVKTAAQYMQGFIAAAAPVLTGLLYRNIIVKTHQTQNTSRARVVVNTIGKRGDPQNAFYWRFLEEGWHTKRGDVHQYPFVAHVFDSESQAAAQLVIDSAEKAIQKAEARAARRSAS